MKQYLTAEEFEQKLKNDFDNLTDEQFNKLILLAGTWSGLNENKFISDIAKYCKQNNTISFKQYKALSSFLKSVKKEYNTKSFNKVSSVVAKTAVEQPTINHWDGGGWKSNGKYQQPINRKKF